MKLLKQKATKERNRREKYKNYKAVAFLVWAGITFFGYYFLLKLVILPRFASTETIAILTRSYRYRGHYTDFLSEISALLAMLTGIGLLLVWNYLKERKGK